MKKFITVLLAVFFLTSLDVKAAGADRGLESLPTAVLSQIPGYLPPREQAALSGTCAHVRTYAPFDFRGKIIVVTGNLVTLNQQHFERERAKNADARARELEEEASSRGNIWFSYSSTGERTRHSREGDNVWLSSAAPDYFSFLRDHKPYVMAPNLPTTLSKDGYTRLLARYGGTVFQHAKLEHSHIGSLVISGKSQSEEAEEYRQEEANILKADKQRDKFSRLLARSCKLPSFQSILSLLSFCPTLQEPEVGTAANPDGLGAAGAGVMACQPLRLLKDFELSIFPILDLINIVYYKDQQPSNPTVRLLLDPAEQALRPLY